MPIRNPSRSRSSQQTTADSAFPQRLDNSVLTMGILGPRDSARSLHLRSCWRWAPIATPGRKQTQNSNRLASPQFCFARSAWPHSANSACLRLSSPPGPLPIALSAATRVKVRESSSSTLSVSIIVGSASCALLMMSSEGIAYRSQAHADVKPADTSLSISKRSRSCRWWRNPTVYGMKTLPQNGHDNPHARIIAQAETQCKTTEATLGFFKLLAAATARVCPSCLRQFLKSQ
jgi:hypothetical protein